jgi:hypothetical protein
MLESIRPWATKQEAGGRKQVAGGRKQVAGNRWQEAGNRTPGRLLLPWLSVAPTDSAPPTRAHGGTLPGGGLSRLPKQSVGNIDGRLHVARESLIK